VRDSNLPLLLTYVAEQLGHPCIQWCSDISPSEISPPTKPFHPPTATAMMFLSIDYFTDFFLDFFRRVWGWSEKKIVVGEITFGEVSQYP
jgi:hypothetical protein